MDGAAHGQLRLVRRRDQAQPLLPDPSQQAVIDLPTGSGVVVVTGAPGTGKTTTLIETVVTRVLRDGIEAGSVLVLAAGRQAAASLRDRITSRLAAVGATALLEPPARTAASFAFSLIRRASIRDGLPSPRLISGPEQDVILADLLAGHRAGDGIIPPWPDHVLPALGLRGLRAELRDLLMRAMERGIDPEGLTRLARRHRRPEWRAAASVYREYLQVTALATPGAYDPAAIVDQATGLLAADDDLLAAERARLRLVAVDDHHESGEAAARLLDVLSPADLVLFGDPDATTQSFRGARPDLIANASTRHQGRDPQGRPIPSRTLVLRTRWRCPPEVVELADRVVERIGALGPAPGQRRSARPAAQPTHGVTPDHRPGQDVVSALVLRSTGAQAAAIAAQLRRAHLVDGLPWSQMAVIVRGARQAMVLRRALAIADIPLGLPPGEVAMRDEPAVRTLVAAVDAALDPTVLDDPDVLDVLLTSVGRADALGLRRLRRMLARHQAAAIPEDPQQDAPLPVDPVRLALADPALLGGLPPTLTVPVRRLREVLQAGHAAVGGSSDLKPGDMRPGDMRPGDAKPGDIESVLWAVWEATGFGPQWRAQALAGGRGGRRADRDLDAVVALFEAAARFVDRLPAAGAVEFLARLTEQDLPEDTLAARAPTEDVVVVTTPQGAAGREWDMVVVAGVQDGVWPNTRLRGSLLGSTVLVDVTSGRAVGDSGRADDAALRAARAEVVHDELRMFHVAVTRARRRLIVTAVSGADEVPSSFFGLVGDPDGSHDPGDWASVSAPTESLTAAAVIARLRLALVSALTRGDAHAADRTAGDLARLAADGVAGADPVDWYGVAGLTDPAPLQVEGRQPRISPSAIESFRDCPLRWVLDRSGGRPPAPAVVGIGTLIHTLVHELPEAGSGQLREELHTRWSSLGLTDGWVNDRLLARAERMLDKLVSYRRDVELVGSEVDFRVVIGEAVLVGRIDRLELDGQGRLVAVDIKTGSSQPATDAVARHPQLGAYQLAVQAGAFADLAPGAGSGGARLLQIGGTQSGPSVQHQPPLSTDPEPQWAADLVGATAAGMAGGTFPATPQPGCRHCPVRSSCPAQPEGRQVGR